MKQLFERVSSYWVRYDKYEIRTDAKGVRYVTSTPDARPQIIDPLEDAQTIVLDALNAGRLFLERKQRNASRKQASCGLATVMVYWALSRHCLPHPSSCTTKRYTCRRTTSSGKKHWKQNSFSITFSLSKS